MQLGQQPGSQGQSVATIPIPRAPDGAEEVQGMALTSLLLGSPGAAGRGAEGGHYLTLAGQVVFQGHCDLLEEGLLPHDLNLSHLGNSTPVQRLTQPPARSSLSLSLTPTFLESPWGCPQANTRRPGQ